MNTGANKIGVMGGTFDPVHIGHLILAQCAYEQLGLEKVMFIPSGNPPHKPNRATGTSDADRIEMVRLAVADNPAFEVNCMEMDQSGPTYTYLTLEKLREEDKKSELYFILGEDSLVDFPTWMKPQEIVKHCRIAVGIRPGSSDEKIDDIIRRVRGITGGEFIRIKAPALEISSHEIRERISKGMPARYYIPDAVLEYIERRGLYI